MAPNDLEVEQGWGDEQPAASSVVDWLHISPGQGRQVIVLSPEPARYLGHWHVGTRRFLKCTQPRCKSCYEGLAKQKRFALAVLDQHGRQWVWEFGDVQAAQVRALLRDGRDLRGLELVLMRPPGRGGNLPLAVNLIEEGEGEGLFCRAALPDPVDVAALLWGVWSRQALMRGKMQEPPASSSVSSSIPGKKSSSPRPTPTVPTMEEAMAMAAALRQGSR